MKTGLDSAKPGFKYPVHGNQNGLSILLDNEFNGRHIHEFIRAKPGKFLNRSVPPDQFPLDVVDVEYVGSVVYEDIQVFVSWLAHCSSLRVVIAKYNS